MVLLLLSKSNEPKVPQVTWLLLVTRSLLRYNPSVVCALIAWFIPEDASASARP